MSFTVRFRVWGIPRVGQTIYAASGCDLKSHWGSKNCTLRKVSKQGFHITKNAFLEMILQAHSNLYSLGVCGGVDCLNCIVSITMHRLLRRVFKIHFIECVTVAFWKRKPRMWGLWCFGSTSNKRSPSTRLSLVTCAALHLLKRDDFLLAPCDTASQLQEN